MAALPCEEVVDSVPRLRSSLSLLALICGEILELEMVHETAHETEHRGRRHRIPMTSRYLI